MNFTNGRYITCGVRDSVDPGLMAAIWKYIDDMPEPKDYLQVFKCSNVLGNQRVIHEQEEPEYKEEYILASDKPFVGKLFVIDDGDHSTMMLAEEY